MPWNATIDPSTTQIDQIGVPILENDELLRGCFPGTSAPASPVEGQLWFRTDTLRFFQRRSGAWVEVSGAIQALSANVTYYVRTDGNDSNTGLANTSGGAFLTIAKALAVAAAMDLNGYDFTIQIGAGTWTVPVVLPGIRGGGRIILQGDVATPSNVLLSTTSADGIKADSVTGRYLVKGLKIVTTTSGHGILAIGRGVFLEFESMQFGAIANSQLYAQSGARMAATGNYTINGSAERHLNALLGGEIVIANRTVTLTGTPAFSTAFVSSARLAMIGAQSVTFSGSATGKRYSGIDAVGVVFTNAGGANYFPGGTAGDTPTNGGQYI